MTTNQDNRRSDVIRCEYCGEDYSVTYRRCPFCDDKAGVPVETRTRKKGGRRVAPTNKRGGGYGGSLRPVQVIGIALSIILIIAAIYIVYSVLAPLFGGSSGDESVSQPAVSVSQPDASAPDVSTPDVSTPDVSTPDVSVPDVSAPAVVPGPDTSSGVVAPIVKATGVTLSKSDVTAAANESFTLKATVTPSNSDDAVVWSSSDETVAKVDQNGKVTNVNTASGQKNATITVTVGDVKATCLVRCKGGSAGGGTATTTPGTPASGTATAMNADGVFNTGNANIRSGPGTNHAPQDSSVLNAEVTVLEETADGWYKIRYSGKGGVATTGYIIKSAVTLK